MMNWQGRQRGFTLFEILVAVSIFALIGVMTMTNLIQVGRSGERISAAQRQLADIQFALGYIGKDLIQMVDREVRDQYGDEEAAFLLVNDTLVFTRSGWANLLGQPRSQLQRVAYRKDDDKLLREYWTQLDQGYEPQRISQTLLVGVEKFEVRLLVSERERIEQWPVTEGEQTSARPIALELLLDVTDFGEIRRVFEVSDGIFET